MFERSPKTLTILDALRGCNRDISWSAIAQAAGEPLAEIRQTIINARRYLERDEGIVFETIRGFGLRRLTDAEKVESAKTFRRKIRRTAVRGVTRIDAVRDMGALSNADQLAATIQRTIFQAVQRETGGQE